MKCIMYTTTEGERWDAIAFKMYGDTFAYEPIIVANRDVPIRPTVAGGIRLRIPVRDAPLPSALPPWKRP